MKTILSENEVAFLYFKEHEERTNLVWTINNWTLRTINESSFHFRMFKVKHFFLNQWKRFLNWSEEKFFPELAKPRFERHEFTKTQRTEEKQEERKWFKYMQRIVFTSWFYEGLQGVVLWNHCFFWWKYEVQIIVKWEEKIVEAFWSDMQIIEDKKKSSKS